MTDGEAATFAGQSSHTRGAPRAPHGADNARGWAGSG